MNDIPILINAAALIYGGIVDFKRRNTINSNTLKFFRKALCVE